MTTPKSSETPRLQAHFRAIYPSSSVPLKSTRKFKPINPTEGTTNTEEMKGRSAAAVAAALEAQGLQLRVGVRFSRRFNCIGIDTIIENGCSSDLLGAGAIEVIQNGNPADEIFCLTEKGVRDVTGLMHEWLLQHRLI